MLFYYWEKPMTMHDNPRRAIFPFNSAVQLKIYNIIYVTQCSIWQRIHVVWATATCWEAGWDCVLTSTEMLKLKMKERNLVQEPDAHFLFHVHLFQDLKKHSKNKVSYQFYNDYVYLYWNNQSNVLTFHRCSGSTIDISDSQIRLDFLVYSNSLILKV